MKTDRVPSLLDRIDPLMSHPWFFPIVLGILGAGFALQNLRPIAAVLARKSETLEVLITARGLPEHHVMREADTVVVEIPKQYAPIGVVRAEHRARIARRAALRPMSSGELLLWSAIDQDYTPDTPSGAITPGYRAVTVLVDEESAIGYRVRPGDHVDLLLTLERKGDGTLSTLTLLQNVAVLSLGPVATEGESGFSSLSLMVLPKEAALIRHAQAKGKLSFALRSPNDHVTAQNNPYIEDEQLFQEPFRQLLQKERNQAVEIIRQPKESRE